MIKTISTDKAPAAIGPYSQAFVTNGFVITSGQIPVNPETGEVLVEKDEKISPEVAKDIQNAGINVVFVNIEGKKAKVIGFDLNKSKIELYKNGLKNVIKNNYLQ